MNSKRLIRMKYVKPDWNNSILNVSATFAEFLGQKNDITKIDELKTALNRKYKNVVYICADGLGMFPLCQNLDENSFLRKNIVKKITSTFPSTTTNATSTLCSATYPSEHGLFGWALWFEEIGRSVEIYVGDDAETKEKVDMSLIEDYLKFDPYWKNSNKAVYTNFPPYAKYMQVGTHEYNFESLEDAFRNLAEICKIEEDKFVYMYLPEPDSTMHRYGVSSRHAKKVISQINERLEQIVNENPNSLFVLTPDHGQTDIKGYIELYKNEALMNTLRTPIYLEARACSFNVKVGSESRFLEAMKKYEKSIELLKVSDLISKNYFGIETEKLKMLGDYIGVVKNDYEQLLLCKNSIKFKGHHTALTEKEMILPLIISENS